jgi:DNA-binding PadR family transcriptional regulator
VALEHAILVSLAERASSGYDLARRFDRSIGQFWSATHQQVYKVLGRMEADGWVSVTVVEQDGRPDKKVYAVTPAGKAELDRWISEPASIETGRSELAVKLRGASYGDLPAVLDEVRRHRAAREARLEYYLQSEKNEFPDPSRLRGQRLHQYLVLRGGIRLEQSLIDWYDEVLASLDKNGRR